MVNAAPVVPPISQYPTNVPEPVIELLVMVIAYVAPAAILGVVIVIDPTLPFNVAVVVPDVDCGFSRSPVPAVVPTKLPFVAVIAPKVAVSEVEAVSDPVTAVLPVAFPMLVAPVPPVPMVVTPAPEVLMPTVPVTEVVPVVTVNPLAAVMLVVDAIDPGAMNVAGTENVSVLVPPVVVN